jgi:glucose-6-phosphate isomerase
MTPDRAGRFLRGRRVMLFDYSKTHIDAEAMALLSRWPRAGVAARREAMFAGEKINETEGRAVLHTALRAPAGRHGRRRRRDAGRARHACARMEAFAKRRPVGRDRGGRAYTDVVNIGIGGSDLGPRWRRWRWRPITTGRGALRLERGWRAYPRHAQGARSGADAGDRRLQDLHHDRDHDQRRTARAGWPPAVDDPGAQFVALSSATDKTAAFGIDPPASSVSRIGSAGAIRSGGRSGWG